MVDPCKNVFVPIICQSEADPWDYPFSGRKHISPDNPIHRVLEIESQLYSKQDLEEAYDTLAAIIFQTEQNLSGTTPSNPRDCIKAVRNALKQLNIQEILDKDDATGMLISSLLAGKYDCDNFGFIALCAAHELNWPLSMVSFSLHVILKWGDGSNATYFDTLSLFGDEDGIFEGSLNKIRSAYDDDSKSTHYYHSMSRSEMEDTALTNRAYTKILKGRYLSAVEDYNCAISRNPLNPYAFADRGVAYFKLGKSSHAIRNLRHAQDMDPADTLIKSMLKVFSKEPNTRDDFEVRAWVEREIKLYDDALRDYSLAIAKKPGDHRILWDIYWTYHYYLHDEERAEETLKKYRATYHR